MFPLMTTLMVITTLLVSSDNSTQTGLLLIFQDGDKRLEPLLMPLANIGDANIIFSAHIYPQGYDQGDGHAIQASDLDELEATNRPCIIGEFGGWPGSGDADVSGIVQHAKDMGWAVIGWAWNGDGEGLNMVTPDWSSEAYPSGVSPSDYFNVIYDLL